MSLCNFISFEMSYTDFGEHCTREAGEAGALAAADASTRLCDGSVDLPGCLPCCAVFVLDRQPGFPTSAVYRPYPPRSDHHLNLLFVCV